MSEDQAVAAIADAASVFQHANEDDRYLARRRLLDAIQSFLSTNGMNAHRVNPQVGHIRRSQWGFNVSWEFDIVIKDLRHFAGYVRSKAEEYGRGLCTPEPIEDDPTGVLSDFLLLEESRPEVLEVVSVFPRSGRLRGLTRSEKQRYVASGTTAR